MRQSTNSHAFEQAPVLHPRACAVHREARAQREVLSMERSQSPPETPSALDATLRSSSTEKGTTEMERGEGGK